MMATSTLVCADSADEAKVSDEEVRDPSGAEGCDPAEAEGRELSGWMGQS